MGGKILNLGDHCRCQVIVLARPKEDILYPECGDNVGFGWAKYGKMGKM